MSAAESPASARLPAAIRDELVASSRAALPNEACGILAGPASAFDGGAATEFHGLRNAAASPFFYQIDAAEQLKVMLAIDDADAVVWGIFHSHVASAPRPSATDVRLAAYPDALYLLCSLRDPDAPEVRAWTILDGTITEVPLELT
ncbi:MAG TPA: M67 family metallopeptidase [Candidatus Sulfotelmatobacter sp.]|nr:M67 family metallopeptidase [Candidatus Sulfotelmatobacter sp.]